MKPLPKWITYAVLGPITGPLVHGLCRSLEGRRPVLAGLYAIAIVETWGALGLIVAHMMRAGAA